MTYLKGGHALIYDEKKILCVATLTLALSICLVILEVGGGWTIGLAVVSSLAIVSAIALNLKRQIWEVRASIDNIPQLTTMMCAAELHSMRVVLDRFPECTLPTTTYSMRFANLHAILCALDRLKPKTIVEFGSGMSTIMVAAWLREQKQGQLISFDHDAEWANQTRQLLGQHELTPFGEVIATCLHSTSGTGGEPWYDTKDKLNGIGEIDVVIVDGPPAGDNGHELSRYPALPVIQERLSDHAIVILDDCDRQGERAITRRWTDEFPEFLFQHVGGITGTGLFEKEPREHVESSTTKA
jgi:predicted O-methyltransferase YrrM